MPVTLTLLSEGDRLHDKTIEDFNKGWDAAVSPRPRVRYIFKIEHRDDEVARKHDDHRAYVKRVGNEQFQFYGMKRTCRIGDNPHAMCLCENEECELCSTLRDSFSWEHHGPPKGKVLGIGIYTTSSTTLAAKWSQSTDPRTHTKAIILSHVAVGKTTLFYNGDQTRWSAPDGKDSITAATQAQGGVFDYPYTVVYKKEAICTGALVIFE